MARSPASVPLDPRPPGLDGIALFGDLDPATRADFARLCRWRRCSADEQILDRDSDSREVWFVAQGTVRVVIYTASGREVALAEVTAGDYFGELAAFDGSPRSASVLAVTDCWVAALPAGRFLALLESHPALGLNVMRRLAATIRTATDRIVALSTLGANNRVQAELLRLALAAGVEGGSARIRPIPIHADMASRVSTTRETVARVLNDLARRGTVTRERDALVVNDVAHLIQLVEDASE